jgi:electron transfer flavoprotein beta subunit
MSLHIIVCIKSVVRSATGGQAMRTPDNSELNPFDRPALEAALQIREARGGTITALSMGPQVGAEALAEAQAMGIDDTVLINDRALAGSDTLVTSRVLAAGIAKLTPYDLILFGMRSSDSDTGQVGPQTATLLGLPFVGGVHQWEHGDAGWIFNRIIDDWEEQWQDVSPAVITVLPQAFAPRAIALSGIAQALDQPILTTWALGDLNLDQSQVGLSGSPTRVDSQKRIKHDRQCQFIPGEPAQQIDTLITQLNTMGLMTS